MSISAFSAPTLQLRCTPIRDVQQLYGLRQEWSNLLERSACNEPMLSPQWLLPWWDIFGAMDGRRLRSLAFRSGDRLVGLALFTSRVYRYRGVIPFRRLEPLGSGERECDSICSDYLNVAAEEGSEPEVAAAFAQAGAEGAAGPWDELVLPMMDGENVMPTLLADAFRALGFCAELSTTGGAPYIELPNSWEQYLKGLTKKHRYSVVRTLRDFEAWTGGRHEFVHATTAAELDQGQRILIYLHRRRWQSENGAGTFRSSRFLAFHDEVMPILHRQRALDLSWLTVRGEPVAAMYNIVWNNKVYYYQCGRDPGVPDSIRPGSVLLFHSIRSAIETGKREFDFLNEVSRYKTQLANAFRPLVQLRVARPGLLELLRRVSEDCIVHTRGIRSRIRKFGRAALMKRNANGIGAPGY